MKIASFIVLCILGYLALNYYWDAEAIAVKDILHVHQQEAELAMEKALWCGGLAALDAALFVFLVLAD